MGPSILVVKPSKIRSLPIKTRVIWVPGIYIYIAVRPECIDIVVVAVVVVAAWSLEREGNCLESMN